MKAAPKAKKSPAHKVGALKKPAKATKGAGEGKDKQEKRDRPGQPTLYRAEYAEMARKFCLLGADDKDLARMFDVDERTINNWKDGHPEFFQSIKAGKDVADAEVASKLFHRACGYSHEAVKIVADAKTGAQHTVPYTEHYPPDTAAGIFWMKNRQRGKWRDKIDQEHSGPDGGPIQVARIERVIVDTKN